MVSAPNLREFPVHHEAVITVTCRTQELPQNLGRAFEEIAQWAARHGVHVSKPFARYTTFTADSCTLEAGFIVERNISVEDGRVHQNDGGYTAFTMIFVGPYSSLGEAYDAIKEQIHVHGYAAAGAPVEYYLTTPETPPQEQKTEIVWPVVVNEV